MAKRLRLIEARKRALLTQAQLATKTGVSQPTISRIENGSSADAHDALALAEFLGLNMREALELAEEEPGEEPHAVAV